MSTTIKIRFNRQSYLATWAGLRGKLWTLLDGQYVTCGCGAEVGKGEATPQYQELEQQSSLGEWGYKCLKELALHFHIQMTVKEISCKA